ncbi:hypothetical protein CHS0354_031540 [Potamilus streckersoni]|uniref:BMP and activin membrane-bound inhibitor homolog n=1 Tax=Potamilus streckersoni TaxID=2493646 RepID=A0AAE0SHA9_9BIVA|nr:hypothetical protein CHS0354_031540 [Potamilus streckersoni]
MAESALGIFILLIYCIAMIEGEIRCQCNESGCVTSAYMCKSQAGICYSLLKSLHGPTTDAVHGCLDNLPLYKQSMCSIQTGAEYAVANGPEEILFCCKSDMCNFYPDFTLLISNRSTPAEVIENDRQQNTHRPAPGPPEKDLWFKAAVIAVPIAGGFILILLVLLAVRMLRTDSRQHRRLIQIRRERSLTKAQLYVSDHFIGKPPMKNCSHYSERHHNAICKDSKKIKVENDGKAYENVCEKVSDTEIVHTVKQSSLPSIAIWGKQTKNDFATVV